ncbi:hypothetical protein MESS4_20058 [Mesorhizobium sp. STM 4661]|nr:hypothetical protein MESS4_20058 [Mesorhizobium sp. STM 4661]
MGLLSVPLSFVLTSHPRVDPVDAMTLFSARVGQPPRSATAASSLQMMWRTCFRQQLAPLTFGFMKIA